ncbi:hypothetical protein M1O29_03975 [Dehalococcoidia bacterium]|nr:hypothetical protein [Dehalococcoidia bacterium]
MELLSPTAEAPKALSKLAPRVEALSGKTIGFIDNGWWSMGLIFDMLEIELKERYGIAQVVRQDKPKSSPVPKQQLETLAEKCDAIITALGN